MGVRTKIEYRCTNENLEGIIAGLDISSEDNILAIAGSGDQAFAMLEYGCKVTAIDNNFDQIRFVNQRINSLAIKDYNAFLCVKNSSPEKYFLKEKGRLDKIHANLDNLKIIGVPTNVMNFNQKDLHFNKIYLSNVLTYINTNQQEILQNLKKISYQIPINGLIYTARYNPRYPCLLWPELGIDKDLSLKAQEKNSWPYFWYPHVFRKLA